MACLTPYDRIIHLSASRHRTSTVITDRYWRQSPGCGSMTLPSLWQALVEAAMVIGGVLTLALLLSLSRPS